MTTTATALLEEIEPQLDNLDGSPTARPMIFQTWADGDGFHRYPVETPDIYDALEAYRYDMKETANGSTLRGFVIVTTGWAAPLGKDGQVEGAPSAHPERVRVTLVSAVARDASQAAAIYFGDGRETVYDDSGTATGSLADALDRVGATLWGVEFEARSLFRRLGGDS